MSEVDARLEVLVDKVVKMRPGSKATVSRLVRRHFPDEDVDQRELLDLAIRLAETCEARGFSLTGFITTESARGFPRTWISS